MEFIRITSIEDPLFAKMHQFMQSVFPAEEVLAFADWAGPLRDESLRVCVALHEGEVVGATEYRYMPDLPVAMTDFTIIGRTGLGIGRFLWEQREADLRQMIAASGRPSLGMFAEVYDPAQAGELTFGGVSAMHPAVRREVLSHMGYLRLDFPYVHPSWQQDGEAVGGLDLCFLPADSSLTALPAKLVADFIQSYYKVLPKKPAAWEAMVAGLRTREQIALRPL